MKKILVALSLCIFLLLSVDTNAQTLKELIEKKKQEAKDKANAKIDQKTSQGIDEAVNSPENMIKKKKEKNKAKKAAAQTIPDMDGNTASTSSSNEVTNGKPNDNGEFIIKTNIKCAAGKTQLENLLRETDGVNSATIDAATGKLYLSASGNTTVYNTTVETIRANGFEADGKKSTSGKNNSCK